MLNDWVTLGRLTSPRGLKGEVWATTYGSLPERLRALSQAFLFGPHGPLGGGEPFAVESAREHHGRWIFKFRGVDSIDEAERLRGAEMRVPLRERPPPPPGEFYLADLVGCMVIDRRQGVELGRVTGWHDHGGPVLLTLDGAEGGEITIPFARSICVGIDTDSKIINVELPEGLLDASGR